MYVRIGVCMYVNVCMYVESLTGQVCDHGLEVQKGLQPTLGDLRLVRGVCRIPPWILQHLHTYIRTYIHTLIILAKKHM